MIIAQQLKTLSAVTVSSNGTPLGHGSGGAANAGIMVQAPSISLQRSTILLGTATSVSGDITVGVDLTGRTS